VPGVALYRAIETGSCLDDMTQSDCHSESICWRHDLDRYRTITHAVTAGFQVVAAVLFAVALYLSSDGGAADVDSPAVSTSRPVTGIRPSSSAERRAPVCNDVMPPASDVTGGVTDVQSNERRGSVYDTNL